MIKCYLVNLPEGSIAKLTNGFPYLLWVMTPFDKIADPRFPLLLQIKYPSTSYEALYFIQDWHCLKKIDLNELRN